MKDLSTFKKPLHETLSLMKRFFNTEKLKDDFFRKYLQEDETDLYVYDIDTMPEKEELIPVSVRDIFTRISIRFIWNQGGGNSFYNFAFVRVFVSSIGVDGEPTVKCMIDLIYGEDMELKDADYYKVKNK